MKYLSCILCLIFLASYANAEVRERPRSTCDFELEMALAQSEGSESIECHTTLFYRSLFTESPYQFGIFMACNGEGRSSCAVAATQLAALTNSQACRDNFYRSLIEAAPNDTTSSVRVFESQLWLPFALKTHGGDIMVLPVTFPEGTEQIDCKGPLFQMQLQRELTQ